MFQGKRAAASYTPTSEVNVHVYLTFELIQISKIREMHASCSAVITHRAL